MPCCTSRRWVTEIVAGRPYRTLPALIAASDAVMAGLEWVDVGQALSAHPRIGERVSGSTTEAVWSRQEQSGTAGLQGNTAQQLLEINRTYERRFGYVFLVCAAGLSAEQLVEAARQRLANDPFAERAVVAEELRKIVRLRLGKAFY
jgi:2-oxo-4-hydroxy-4-carboxy-5-ureidoimidazoline decarboxylase